MTATTTRTSPAGIAATGAVAFLTYFCVYAFRKPFTAASFDGLSLGGWDYKTVLVTSQVLGYMTSKFLGVKYVSEIRPDRRAVAILGLVAWAELMLVLLGLVPAPWNFAFLFLNGLSLGMVFSLVLGYLEGRRHTEALSAGLCASFILADGATKSVGAYLLGMGVGQFWMPAVSGLLFLPVVASCTLYLSRVAPPDEHDERDRGAREPIDGAARWALFRRHAPGLSLLIGMFTLVTILRSMRADFAPEIWKGLGLEGQPSIFTRSELFVAAGVLAVNGFCCLIRDNRRAFFTAKAICLAGLALMFVALRARETGAISPFAFMVAVGLGLYLPYVAVHTTIFERLLAMTRDRGNIAYLMCLADAAGYLGYVAVMMGRSVIAGRPDVLDFFLSTCWVLAGLSAALVAGSWAYFGLRGAAPRVAGVAGAGVGERP